MTRRETKRSSARLPLRRQLEQQQFGGGGTTPNLPAVPSATPPVTETSAEVVQASQDLRRQALKKRGFSKTYLAGDDGGWMANTGAASATAPKVTPGGAATALPKTLGGGPG